MNDKDAALTVQKNFRAFSARQIVKGKLLFETWSKIDLKEESELKNDINLNQRIISDLEKKQQKAFADKSSVLEEHLMHIQEERNDEVNNKSKEGNEEQQLQNNIADLIQLTDINQLDFDYVTNMMDSFREGKLLSVENIMFICNHVKERLKAQININYVTIPSKGRVTLVGDIHGQLDDLFSIFKLNGLPNDESPYIFNGDWVDRGPNSVEVVMTIFSFYLLYPESVFMNRGNHEARDINSRDGFEKECIEKYVNNNKHNKHNIVFDSIENAFSTLPLASIIEDKIFICHAGLFYDDILIQDILDFNRFHDVPPTETLMEDMLWSDPCAQNGRFENPRGCALEFGPDVLDKFLSDNNLMKVMRSHECVNEGYEEWFNGKLVTVFSASNYTGTVGNKGAIAIFEKHDICNPRYVTYMAQKTHELKRVNMIHGLLAEDIVIKLLMRITTNRLNLINYYMKLHPDKDDNIISREEWSQGLVDVLQLKVPFNHFEEYLGLPQLGINGEKNGPIDYMSFLHRFKPKHPVLTHESNCDDYVKLSIDVKNAFEDIAQIIFSKRFALESVFRYLDTNGDNTISAQEFYDGILSLTSIYGRTYSAEVLNSMIDIIDTNKDGVIEFNEFFDCFHTVDETLLNKERILNSQNANIVKDMPNYKDE